MRRALGLSLRPRLSQHARASATSRAFLVGANPNHAGASSFLRAQSRAVASAATPSAATGHAPSSSSTAQPYAEPKGTRQHALALEL